MNAEEILKLHISKTVNLSTEQFEYFFSHFTTLSFKKGQALISEGDKVEHEYFVLDGCLKSFYINDKEFCPLYRLRTDATTLQSHKLMNVHM